jgi:dephospho-CoA kinase
MLLALTGGPATGKSTLAGLLAARHTFEAFDADACVHELLSTDGDIIRAVRYEFSLPQHEPPIPIDRALLRQRVFSAPSTRRRLEAIIHPVVRQRWMALRSECLDLGQDFLADIPLLFETGGASHFDAVVLVAASTKTQRIRLAAKGLEPSLAEAMLASQWPIGQKVAEADHIVWNDGSLAGLERQASLLLDHLFSRAA